MPKEQRNKPICVVIAAALLAVLLFLRFGGVLYRIEALWVRIALTAGLAFAAYLFAGIGVLMQAADAVTKGKLLESAVSVTLITLLLFALGDHAEAAAVMLLYAAGSLVCGLLTENIRSRALPADDALPKEVFARRGNDFAKLSADEAVPGDLILIGPGEMIPLDGTVEEGASEGDLSPLTGGSDPLRIRKGSDVVSGTLNGSSPLIVRAGKDAASSTVQRLSALLRTAPERPAKTERLALRSEKVLKAAIVVSAVVLAVLVPLIAGGGFPEWIRRGAALLAAVSPQACAFAVPLAFLAGAGAAARKGVYPEGNESLERLSEETPEGEKAPAEERLRKAGLVMPVPDDEKLDKAAEAAKKTVRTARLNLAAGLTVTALSAALAAFGLLSAGPVTVVTVLFSVLAVLNVLRLSRD